MKIKFLKHENFNNRDHVDFNFKIVVLGNERVGKSWLINCLRLQKEKSDSHPLKEIDIYKYRHTGSPDDYISYYSVTHDNDNDSIFLPKLLRVTLLEIPTNFHDEQVYIRGLDAAIVVYSADSQRSFESVPCWLETCREKNNNFSEIIIGVCDKYKEVSKLKLDTYAKNNNSTQAFEVNLSSDPEIIQKLFHNIFLQLVNKPKPEMDDHEIFLPTGLEWHRKVVPHDPDKAKLQELLDKKKLLITMTPKGKLKTLTDIVIAQLNLESKSFFTIGKARKAHEIEKALKRIMKSKIEFSDYNEALDYKKGITSFSLRETLNINRLFFKKNKTKTLIDFQNELEKSISPKQ